MKEYAKRSKLQRELDRAKTQELLLQGWTQQEIGDELGVSRSTIYKDIVVVCKRLQESQIKSRKKLLALRQTQINRVLRKAWESYKKSCEDQGTLVSKEGADGQSMTETLRGQHGDPAVLAKILDCIEMHCKLEGLYAPTKFSETDAAGNDLDPETLAERRARVLETLGRLGFFGETEGTGGSDQRDSTDPGQLPANP